MSRWLEPFQEKYFPCLNGSLNWLMKTDWCPPSTRIYVTPNGSIDGEVIKDALEHVKKLIRKHVCPEKSVLILDGHAYRNSLEWLQYGAEKNLKTFRLPANTSHLLQPFDQAINRVFKQSIRAALDAFLSNCHTGFANVAFKLKLAAARYKAISNPVIEKAFVTAGLWPVDYRFVSALQNKEKGRGTCSITTGARAAVSTGTAVYDAHVAPRVASARAYGSLTTGARKGWRSGGRHGVHVGGRAHV